VRVSHAFAFSSWLLMSTCKYSEVSDKTNWYIEGGAFEGNSNIENVIR